MAWKVEEQGKPAPFRGASMWLYGVRDVFTKHKLSSVKCLKLEDISIGVMAAPQALWLRANWPSGGGVAIRMTYTPNEEFYIVDCVETEGAVQYDVSSDLGDYHVRIELDPERSVIHFTTRLTPFGELSVPFWPSDAYPMNADGDPLNTKGEVHAAQRGYATAFIYATLTEPRSGSLLYLQDLTSLNDYCEQTHTVPEARVGGSWPELGYTPPLAERKPLKPGKEVVISDGYLKLVPMVPANQAEVARTFLELLSDIYTILPKPEPVYHDWLTRAEKAVEDLDRSPECTTELEGHRYLNAYVGTGDRRPESLVQLTVLPALREYADWGETDVPLADDLSAGLLAFMDHEIGSMLRYPESSKDAELEDEDEKGPHELDSWYLYHPLVNLARLARMGDDGARQLLRDSLDYAVKVAQHFEYRWPILFDAQTLTIIRRSMLLDGEQVIGEADVGGVYAYLMYLAWELFDDNRYLDEARNALKTLENMRFSIGYQFNNTAWMANAAMHLWRATGDDSYKDIGYMAIASIFQNTMLWECSYGNAKHYSTFFGVTPLRQGFYLAMYEEYEIFAAFHEYLTLAEGYIPDCVSLLLAEYCKHALSRTWCYYPSELPQDVITDSPRNGRINRDLTIPLEDVYQGWEVAGQVGQEVYGAAAPLAFAVRSYHKITGMPFMVYCDYPIFDLQNPGDGDYFAFQVRGTAECTARLRLIPEAGTILPATEVRYWGSASEGHPEAVRIPDGQIEFTIAGNSRVEIRCKAAQQSARAA